METSVLNEETSVLNGESSVLNGEISVLTAPMAAFCEAVDAESGAGSVKVDDSLETTEGAGEKNGDRSPPTGTSTVTTAETSGARGTTKPAAGAVSKRNHARDSGSPHSRQAKFVFAYNF